MFFALRFYNWIPESVFSITSVTTAKPGKGEVNQLLDLNRLSSYLELIASPALAERWEGLQKYLAL